MAIDVERTKDSVTLRLPVGDKRIRLTITHERAQRLAMEVLGIDPDGPMAERLLRMASGYQSIFDKLSDIVGGAGRP